MPERQYNPTEFSKAMGLFKEYLKQASPEAFEMLFDPTVGFNYTPEAFEWTFLPLNSEDKYKRLAAGPLFEILGAAARAAGFNLKLRCGDHETSIQLKSGSGQSSPRTVT
jgi:hypothetical protein